MALINELPAELLVRIFCDVRNIHTQSYSHGWIHITHVCRDWRNIALDAAELWTQIYSVDPDCVQAFLTRSKNVPLDIRYSVGHRRTTCVDAVLPMLLSESFRFRHVELVDPGAVHTFLLHPFPGGAPLLITLHLDVHSRHHNVEAELINSTPRLSKHGLPALQQLALSCWPVASLAAIRGLLNPSLRALTIRNPPTQHSTREWAEILTDLPLLEELTLHSVFPRRNTGAVPPVGQGPIPLIHLPHLLSLRLLEDTPAEQLSLIRHITTSTNVHITVGSAKGPLRSAHHEASFEHYTGILHALGQTFMRGRHKTLNCPISLDLCFGGMGIRYNADDHGGTVTRMLYTLRVTLSAIPNDINSVSYCPQSAPINDTAPIFMLHSQVLDAQHYDFSTPLCNMLRTTFSWSTLRQFRFAPLDNFPTTPGQGAAGFAACRDLFLQMTNLRELSIVVKYPNDSLFALLGVVGMPAVPPEDETDSIAQIPFPILEVLTIRQERHKEIMNYEPLSRILLSRKAIGYPVPRVHICPFERRVSMLADSGDLVAKLQAAVVPLTSVGCFVDACIDKNNGNRCIEELVSAE